MAITNVQPAPEGAQYTWGFDTDAGKWVPVDVQAVQGSTAGNLLRAAGRGAEEIRLGIGQMAGAPVGPDIAELSARTQAAAAGAPIAESVGGFAPEAVAGTLGGIATGGMGFLPMLLAEGAAGGAATALRPGGFEERMMGALETAGLNIAGGVAAKGILSAIPVVRGLLGATQNRIFQGVEAAGTQIDAGRANAAAIEAMVPQGGVAPELRAGAAPGVQQPGSVGAATTPAEQIPPELAQENLALATTEAAGANITTDIAQQMRATAEGHGYRSPLGAGTRLGSPARLAAAAREAAVGDVFSSQLKADNQALLSTKLADALGLPKPETITSIDPGYHLADAEATTGRLFDQVEKNLPAMSSGAYARALESVKPEEIGAFGRLDGQKIVNDAIDKMRASDTVLSGAAIKNDREWLSSKMADFYAKGDTKNGDILRDALGRLDDKIEQMLKQKGDKQTLGNWQRARTQWQLLTMAKSPGVISKTGDVNPVSLVNKMWRDRDSGGFGRDGPMRGTKARVVYDIARIAAADETHVPMTGFRGLIQKQMAGGVGSALRRGAVGAVGFDATRRLLD